MCACMYVCMLRVGWGRQMFKEKFVYADFVGFDVGCFSLIMKCALTAHPRKTPLSLLL